MTIKLHTKGWTLKAVERLRNRFYGNLIDRAEQFTRIVMSYARKDRDVLHAGCGLDNSMNLKDCMRQIIGIDVDNRIVSNEDVDLPIIGDLQQLPLRDASVDVIISKWVVEHIADPIKAWSEIARVLRSNGLFILMTPNMLHYAVIATRVTPHRMHKWFMSSVLKISSEDVFPTYLRANTVRKLRWLGVQSELSVESLQMFEGPPMFFAFSPILFLLGILYERLVNHFRSLERLRSVIIMTYRKTS